MRHEWCRCLGQWLRMYQPPNEFRQARVEHPPYPEDWSEWRMLHWVKHSMSEIEVASFSNLTPEALKRQHLTDFIKTILWFI